MQKPDAQTQRPIKVVLITGPAGAGRSTAINALEDLGFEAIDNLPLTLLPRLLSGPPMNRHLALGVDSRNRDFNASTLIDAVDIISKETDFDCSLLFLDCATDVLVRRYSETRRRHPLAPDETPLDGIRAESELLVDLKNRADMLIDTSEMSPHDLRREIDGWFGKEGQQSLSVSVQSFSYKRGLPRGMDMVLDCRFLANPHWDKKLRDLNGQDPIVADFVRSDPLFDPFFERMTELIEMLLPAYDQEGKSHFTVGLGCTGGQHRSVCVAEMLANTLANSGWQVSSRHRELERHHVGESGVR